MQDISESEFTLLIYLHENVRGFGRRHGLPAPEIREALYTDDATLARDASYLEGLGFVETEGYQAYANPNVDSTFANEGRLLEISLTSAGESFCRILERDLPQQISASGSLTKKITSKIALEFYETSKAFIVQVLANITSQRF